MNDQNSRVRRGMSRRTFVKLAAAGLLAGCAPAAVTPTSEPAVTATPETPPTATPVAEPTATRTPRPTATVPATPTSAVEVRRPEAVRFYPDVTSKVVHTHHGGAWEGGDLVPGALRQMLDASITALTGLNDARQAWQALFAPDERIAIKVNAFRNSLIWTHPPLVTAVTDALQDAGIPAEQIVVFDYYTSEMIDAGYTINESDSGVRCLGTDTRYAPGWIAGGASVQLSEFLLQSHALINMPVLKSHMLSGFTFALKNHYGTVHNPGALHSRIGRTMAELNAAAPIKDRTRLVIGDVLAACVRYAGAWPYWEADWKGDSLLMSFDPVAHDAVGFGILKGLIADVGDNPARAESQGRPCLDEGARLGLGMDKLEEIDLQEVTLS